MAIAALPSNPKVIVTGRRQERLDQLKSEAKLETVRFDQDTTPENLKVFVDDVVDKYPDVGSVSVVVPQTDSCLKAGCRYLVCRLAI